MIQQKQSIIMLSPDDIQDYQSFNAMNSQQTALLSGVADTEMVGIKGAISVPSASNFSESKKNISELSGDKGDLAKVKNIDVCSFLPKLPEVKIPEIEIPGLGGGEGFSVGDIAAEINGIAMKGVGFVSSALEGALAKIDEAKNKIGDAIQQNVPNITCGQPIQQTIPKRPPAIGEALQAPTVPGVPSTPSVPSVPYGVSPNITIESPDVTVKSIDDELDAGEFT